MAKVRTTIVLPEEDVRHIKMLAATYGLTMSEVVQESVRGVGDLLDKKSKDKEKKTGWRAVAGSLHLGGKEPYKRRSDLYEEHLRRKFSR